MRSTEGKIKLTIQYWNSMSIRVYADEKLIDQNSFDKELGAQALINGYKGCGENRWNALKNQLEFIMTPFCTIRVDPYEAIQSNVRMSWTMDEFFEKGGPTSFIDRVSAALGIHASQMKVVAVYEGSLVVDYEIAPEETEDSSTTTSSSSSSSSTSVSVAAQLRAIETKLNEIIQDESSSAEMFGAPVLSASTNDAAIIEDPTYNPISKPTPTTRIDDSEDETTEEGEVTITVNETARNSMIGVFVVIVLIVACCFGLGTLLVCALSVSSASTHVYQIQKKHAANLEAKRQGLQNASNSVIEVD